MKITYPFYKSKNNNNKQRYFALAAFLIFFLLFAFHAAEAQQGYSNISLGSSLTPDTNNLWLSPSGLYAFGFFKQTNGFSVGIFLTGIPEKTVIWTTNSDNNPTVPSNVTLLLTSDGKLILQPTQSQEIYIANPSEPIAIASMLNTGNFVLYNRNQKIIWQSFGHSTNTLLEGQRLSAEQQLFSCALDIDYSKGIFHLIMNGDGNLALYPIEEKVGNAYYTTNTYGHNVTLNLDDDGHLYLKNSTSIMKSITTGGHPRQRTIYLMRLDFDGILHVYSQSLLDKGNLSEIWSSTNDWCNPKGLCGLNGLCVQMDEKADCLCLPGFDFINPDKWSSGCERNFTAKSCKTKDATLRYDMRRSDNIVSKDNSYSVLEDITMEDCEAACLEDCNCEAAFYNNQQCRKQRLPLRYGR